MSAPKSGGLPRQGRGQIRSELERDKRKKKMQGPPVAPKPPSKDLFKKRDTSGKVIRALAGASVPPARKIR